MTKAQKIGMVIGIKLVCVAAFLVFREGVREL